MDAQSPDVALPEAVSVPDASATEPQASAPQGDTQSVLSTLRELRSQLGAGATPIDLLVPGFEGLLVIRCGWVPFKALSKRAQSLKDMPEVSDQQVAAACDAIILTCKGIFIKAEGEAVGFPGVEGVLDFSSPELPALLGFPNQENARETVKAVFGGNEYAVLNFAGNVVTWLQDTSASLDAELLGN